MRLPGLSLGPRSARWRRGVGVAGALALLVPALALLAGGGPASWPAAVAQPVQPATATATTPARSSGANKPVVGRPTAPASTTTTPIMPRGTRAQVAAAAAAGPGVPLTWGNNDVGQLGDGTNLGSSTAVPVQGVTGATLFGVGGVADWSLVLRRDGTVVAWGLNSAGQLGRGTTGGSSSIPAPVQGLPTNDPVVALATGTLHGLALTQSGTVYAWGSNASGELGDPAAGAGRNTAGPVKNEFNSGNLLGIVAIAAGGTHSLAVTGNGTVYAWGSNDFGELGDNTTTDRSLPVAVHGVGNSGTLSIGICSAAAANCQVAAGVAHSLVRDATGRIFAWGINAVGELGNNNPPTNSGTPVVVLPVTGGGQLVARSIAAGQAHSLAILNDGSVVAWGYGADGEVGDGAATERHRPVPVTVEAGGGPLTGVTAVAGGSSHSLALTTGGTVYAIGGGTGPTINFGQVGDGTLIQRNRAVPVLNLSGITAISAGYNHSLALGPDFPLATVTPQPTATPQFTATPQPTATPQSTATPYIYQPPAASAAFYPIPPVRILDTRASDPPGILHVGFDENGAVTPTIPIQTGVSRRFLVAGQTFSGTLIPATARAVNINVTALPTAGFGGFLSIYPGNIPDAQRPLTSVLNPILAINNNLFVTTLGPAGGPNAGTFAAYSQAVPLDLVIDIVGYYQ